MLCPKTHKPPASDGFIPNSTITWRNRISLYYRTTLTRKERKEGKEIRKEGKEEKEKKEERERTKGKKERQKENNNKSQDAWVIKVEALLIYKHKCRESQINS